MRDYDESKRRQIFADNYRRIRDHNKEADKGVHTYRLGVNQFTDMTDQEFSATLRNVPPLPSSKRYKATQFVEMDEQPLDETPDSFNWCDKGVVTMVKNQQNSPTCFAFAAVDTIESHYKIGNPREQLLELSVQQAIDGLNDPTVWRDGGDMRDVYRLAMRPTGGLALESDYPYIDRPGPNTVAQTRVTMTNYCGLDTGDEMALMGIVGTKGPVAVGLHINGQKLRDYESGVFTDSTGDSNHAVVVVGYGTVDGRDYWLIKNSYSDTWGERGYMKLARNCHNVCGIANDCVYPIGVRPC
ncbi:unnamed protein product [Medioppia subpectinata]|uniref:Uncharacterized protein n=1 Tax=Medioppia subpectinata TaxID=1979941 RepID=A0A7R9Q4E9_9ACAR|nr:unnamed protein product [Medioppia subpectinata]CAG2112209.1 unnamed protein product [Medioppia subpectinata]